MTTNTTSFNSLKTANAIVLRNAIASGSANLYFWLARSSAWTPSDSVPDVPLDNTTTDVTARQALLYLTKVNVEDVALSIPRINWTSGVIYTPYSSTDINLLSEPFYVLASGNVYKCMGNNGGIPSTSSPALAGISPTTNETPDGYNWKFMFNLTSYANMSTVFLTTNFIPVPVGGPTYENAAQINVEDAATFVTGSPPGGHGKNPSVELGVNSIIINKIIDLEGFDSPGDISHRQFGLIMDPLLTNGNKAVDVEYFIYVNKHKDSNGSSIVADSNGDPGIDTMSGIMINCTNHLVVSSAVDDTETIQVVIQF